MSLLTKGGITRLSELEIDADKDWQARGISNLKELAPGMVKGDLVVRGGSVLQRLTPGNLGNVLTSDGPWHIPIWAPCAGEFERFIGAWIETLPAAKITEPDMVDNLVCVLPTEHTEDYLDAPAYYIKRLTPGIALDDTEALVTPDKTHGSGCSISAAPYSWKKAVDGAVADDGGVQNNETAAAQDGATNDMTLLPLAPAVDDAYYFGFDCLWNLLWLNVGQAGIGNWGLAHEYWDGGVWSALSDVIDGTSEFTLAGLHAITFTRPGDWARTTIQGMNLYWIRARVTSFFNITTQPLGTQAWCERIL